MHCADCGSNLNANAVYCPYCGAHVLGAEENEEYVYEAFISYRHSPEDRAAALRIQHFLEGASIPKELRTPERGSRLGRLFRDEDELTTADSLPDLILDALNKSRYLIVLCSPAARQSQWVMREVEAFAQLHGRNRILPVLVEGEPEESFPPLLLTRMERDPESGMFVEVRAEPLAADLRKKGKREVDKEITRLEATILDCGLDDLQQRIRMRRLRMNVAISLIIALVSLLVGAFALYQRAEIILNLIHSQVNESRILARESQDKLEDGDRFGALRTALKALPGDTPESYRPLVPDAQLALERALGFFPRQSIWYGYLVDGAGERFDCRDGVMAKELYGNSVAVSSVEAGQPLVRVYPVDDSGENNVVPDRLSNFKLGNGTVLSVYERSYVCFNYNTRELLWDIVFRESASESSNVLYLAGAKQYVLAAESVDVSGEFYILFCDEMTGECVRKVRISTQDDDGVRPLRLAVSEDEQRVAVAMAHGDLAVDLIMIDQDTVDATTDVPRVALAKPDVKDLVFFNDDLMALSMDLILVVSPDEWASVAFELFDGNLARKWVHEETASVSNAEVDYQIDSTAGIVGPVWETDESSPLIACTFENELLFLDYTTGEVRQTERSDAPIVEAAVVPQDVETCLAVCTNEAKVYLRHPFTGDAKDDEAYTTFFNSFISSAYPIYDEGIFRGFSAWTSSPQSCRIFLMDEHTDTSNCEPANDVQGEIESDGKSIISYTEDTISLIDNNTFERRWTTSLSSIGFKEAEDGVMPLVYLTGESVFVCDMSLEVAKDNQRKVCELSLKDGSLVNDYQLPWGDNPKAPMTMNDVIDFCQVDGRRLMAISNMYVCMVYDLDTSEVILEEASDESTYFFDVLLTPDSLITGITSESRWGVFKVYSLDTGEEMDPSAPLMGMATAPEETMVDFASEDRSVLAVRCFDGQVRAYNTHDGSKVWEFYGVSNVQFLRRVSSSRMLVQDSSGRCYLLDVRTGEMTSSSEVKLPTLSGCSRMEDGSGFAVLNYWISKPYYGQSLVTFSLDESDDNTFGPIGEVNYGECFAANGEKVLVNAAWGDGYLIYDRPGLEELIDMAQRQVDVSKGLGELSTEERYSE